MTTLVWFRQDLRLRDNPALAAATGAVIPLFILDETDPWQPGGASRWWLHHSLAALTRDLGGLLVMQGDPQEIVPALVEKTGAKAIHWNRCYEAHAIARDMALKKSLAEADVAVKSFNAALLHEPWEIATQSGTPFKVFTPYWRVCLATPVAPPLHGKKPDVTIPKGLGLKLDDLELLPRKPNWARSWETIWTPGERGAAARLDTFLEDHLADYADGRDRPDLPNISRLSPHLHWGEISPRQIWAKLSHVSDPKTDRSLAKFRSELGWREFSHHLLYHFPSLPDRNWRGAFDAYPWSTSEAHLTAWQKGSTGYPFVDAGMRELWQTGFLHNRVRMVAASFLIKHLRIDWREGERWFWDTLVDADLANNASGWQWVAGSGADAAPYFRIFNPIAQGQKFDPQGDYVRRWCPELAKLPPDAIHAPFDADESVLKAAGVKLGVTYPKPIVDHDAARKAALEGYEKVKGAGD